MIIAFAIAAFAQPLAGPVAVDCKLAGPAFMQAYANDLQKGDRAAIASRYSAEGSYTLGFTPKKFEPLEKIRTTYADPRWRKPDAFRWQDLSYEQLAADTCLVTGGFVWIEKSDEALMAYTAVLKAEVSGLKIFLEHENALKTTVKD